MIIWGAIWGAILSVSVSRRGDWEWMVGAFFGALAGWTLRRAVRSEIARVAKTLPATVAVSPVKTPMSVDAATQPLPTMPEPAMSAMPAIAPVAALQATAMADVPPAPSAAPAPVAIPAPIKPSAPNAVEVLIARAKNWLFGGNTVARVGTVVLFIGLSFLAKWAADNSLFPPELRLAAIGLVGIVLLVQGFRFARRSADDEVGAPRSNYGLLLQGAGVAVLYLTVFAAYKMYAMIPPLAAFALMALVCALSTLLALLANAQTLAVVGFAGAFATPILLSTGQGSHVSLFSYYVLLNVAIAVVAWLRPWRALNLVGFLSTFGVATAWGALKYAPEHYASTQPFLIAFFAIYVMIGLFYALRHSDAKGHTLDGMLIFGTPIVAFALQTELVAHIEYAAAISAVVASFVYIALAFVMRSRVHPLAHWLTLSYAALALIFATLAVPLALDGQLTAAIWAIEGAGVFWLATKQGRWMGQAFGALMQLLAALAFMAAFDHHATANVAFANSHFVGTVMLAVGALAVSWWAFAATRDSVSDHAEPVEAATAKRNTTSLLPLCSTLFFLVGFAWALFGVWREVVSSLRQLSDATRFGLFTVSTVALAFSAFIAWRRTGWTSARLPVFPVLPFLILCAAIFAFFRPHAHIVFELVVYPLAVLLHLIMLRGVDALSPQRWWRAVHTGNTLLIILLIGGFLYRAVDAAGLRHSDWAAVILLFACTLVMLALASARVWTEPARGWPLDRFQREYAVRAGFGVAVLTTVSALIVACTASGNAAPLPYVPLLNPVDLCAFLALASVALWMKRVRASGLVAGSSRLRGGVVFGLVAFAAFIVINTVWLRFAHHFRDIEWNANALADSFFVQAGYSMLWTLLGVAAMVWAHRHVQRKVWQAGAALLALTVLKLLVVDLENSGGGERIVAFIGVGVLMVVVGYFAPMPPLPAKQIAVVEKEAAHETA